MLLDDVVFTATLREIIERARMKQLLPRGHGHAQQAGALSAPRSTATDTTIEHHHHLTPPTSGSFKLWHGPGLRAAPKLFRWPQVRPPHVRAHTQPFRVTAIDLFIIIPS